MSTMDKFKLAQTETVTFQPTHEQSPEDIFNFDTENIDKFIHKGKSILLSNTEKSNSKKTMMANDIEPNSMQSNAVQNIICNKLYDDVRSENLDQIDYKAESKRELNGCAGEQRINKLRRNSLQTIS